MREIDTELGQAERLKPGKVFNFDFTDSPRTIAPRPGFEPPAIERALDYIGGKAGQVGDYVSGKYNNYVDNFDPSDQVDPNIRFDEFLADPTKKEAYVNQSNRMTDTEKLISAIAPALGAVLGGGMYGREAAFRGAAEGLKAPQTIFKDKKELRGERARRTDAFLLSSMKKKLGAKGGSGLKLVWKVDDETGDRLAYGMDKAGNIKIIMDETGQKQFSGGTPPKPAQIKDVELPGGKKGFVSISGNKIKPIVDESGQTSSYGESKTEKASRVLSEKMNTKTQDQTLKMADDVKRNSIGGWYRKPGETAITTSEASKSRDGVALADSLAENISTVRNMLRSGGLGKSNSTHRDRLIAAMTGIQLDIKGKSILELGVLAGPDLALINNMAPSLSWWTNGKNLLSAAAMKDDPEIVKTLLAQYEDVDGYIDRKTVNMMKSRGYYRAAKAPREAGVQMPNVGATETSGPESIMWKGKEKIEGTYFTNGGATYRVNSGGFSAERVR